MIIAHFENNSGFEPQEITDANKALLEKAGWIDMFCPTKSEDALVKECLGIEVPTRDEMVEIELSSRLYKESDHLFMTVTMIAQTDMHHPKLDPVTCILTPKQLITVRYIEPQSFKLFISQLKKLNKTQCNGTVFLIELLDANIDFLADTLELIGRRLDEYSKVIFQSRMNSISTKLDYRQLMQQIGENEDLNSKSRESLVAFNRLIPFFGQNDNLNIDHDGQLRLGILSKDIAALSDHASFVSNKVIFLLDATLGMVTIEQNNIIKIFSVAAVIFLPPTLIASIYGMNFHIPELTWRFGYLYALILMVLSSWGSYKYIKSRKWM